MSDIVRNEAGQEILFWTDKSAGQSKALVPPYCGTDECKDALKNALVLHVAGSRPLQLRDAARLAPGAMKQLTALVSGEDMFTWGLGSAPREGAADVLGAFAVLAEKGEWSRDRYCKRCAELEAIRGYLDRMAKSYELRRKEG